MNTQNYHSSDL